MEWPRFPERRHTANVMSRCREGHNTTTLTILTKSKKYHCRVSDIHTDLQVAQQRGGGDDEALGPAKLYNFKLGHQ